jgi:outer membrane protein assembly factor BamB
MSASPLIEGSSIFAGALNGSIYRLNKTDGRVDGICAANGSIRYSPAVLDGAVYTGTQEGVLYACG